MKKENIVGLKILREDMDTYISKVEKGESVLVMRKSSPIFVMSPVDEWGDEGTWKTLIDFRKIKKGGIPVNELIAAFERFDEQNKKIHRKAGRRKA